MSALRADPMAVGADDVALRGLGEERRHRPQHRAARTEPKAFARPVPMVEVHLVRSELEPAVDTRSLPTFPQELDRAALAGADTGYLN
jgi:hypothetical protein